MKFNIPKIAYFLIFSYLAHYQPCSGTINFFIRPYPAEQATPAQKLQQQIETPGRLSAKTVKNRFLAHAPNAGIFGTYEGYLAITDLNGQISFPRKTTEKTFNLLITPNIKPIFMIGNTIHHWELDHSVPSELYTITQKQDPTTKRWLWKTEKGRLPHNNIITLNTIIIFAKPINIYVPVGVTLTTDNPQLMLPDIYAKKSLNIPQQALKVLTLRQFFGPLKKQYKEDSPTAFSEQITAQ